ncbi:hypothetical protein TNCT_535331 [Trichonephila clavata]|uniref:Uncharacterized protein n=1 Tax=Trichonephila clavata TaxID=2740835 RepID=A0A8X6LRS4_TRICU|nr:hypothetical protein TNCT_535331 [Trichonephila clavata]
MPSLANGFQYQFHLFSCNKLIDSSPIITSKSNICCAIPHVMIITSIIGNHACIEVPIFSSTFSFVGEVGLFLHLLLQHLDVCTVSAVRPETQS